MRSHYIPAGVAGTRVTLQVMRDLARAGSFDIVQMFPMRIEPRALDAFLRERWTYLEDGSSELIREVKRNSGLQGDCDDAGVIAGAFLCSSRNWANLTGAAFVALRPPRDAEFRHVYTLAFDDQGVIRIDPIAPADADYNGWEQISEVIF